MRRFPLFVAGLENAQDRIELMRTIQKSKEEARGPADAAADMSHVPKHVELVPAPRCLSYKVKRQP
jgi:hypothetical protein